MKKILMTAAALVPVLVGCGGSGVANNRNLQTSCSMALRANATATEVQHAINDVLAYRLDACGGAVSDLRSYRVELERIDEEVAADSQRRFVLAFRLSHQDLL